MANGVFKTISEWFIFFTCLPASTKLIGRVDLSKSPPRMPPIIKTAIIKNEIIENPMYGIGLIWINFVTLTLLYK